jgi:hypothetical protein
MGGRCSLWVMAASILCCFGNKMIMLQCSSQRLPRNDPLSLLPRWPASLLIKKLTYEAFQV